MTKKPGKAEMAGIVTAKAIVLITDLFYQVDTRDRFMNSLLVELGKHKKCMDIDRAKRRQ